MNKDNLIHLKDILAAAERIKTSSDSWVSARELNIFDKEFAAILHWLSMMGEAVSRLTNDFKETYNHIPWGGLKGMRNFVVHEYDNINADLIFESVKHELPSIIENIKEIIKEVEENEKTI